ncbi:ATP synthase subunit B family protein [Actinomadura rudentiformis]|uniref:DoxX family membrane protein n=1 Tax=Actinomadura rudentiformis TaxID=359158 RepID=A0A6H9YUC2_9ACTN|nr:DoxX family membrane protein [Actinomadura rudentiformis]KAB2343364.1 DoxX family membrane protein [Actinomadura rudentiformis]
MRPFTTLARPFVAAPYIITGLETLRDPRPRAEQVAPTVKPIADRLDWLPTKDPESLVRIEGALSLGTGVLLLTGKFRRATTFLMAAQLVPALASEHRYWTEDDPERRNSERSHLLKNASLFGALLMVATEPRRGRRVGELRQQIRDTRVQAAMESKALRKEAKAELKNARKEAARQIKEARRQGDHKTAQALAKSAKAARSASKATVKGTSKAASKAGTVASKAGSAASKPAQAAKGKTSRGKASKAWKR